MIIGTAGHVDHGKSALVTALTGRSVDRLAEEQRRGITIDLNFAPLALGGGVTAGIIDVPGHEDLVRTMAAGATGIDAAVLVIAADEGVMPQTEEHLLILERLGVRSGVAVITKVDASEPAWLALVREDVEQRLGRSPIAWGDVIETSVRDGRGLEAVLARLGALAAAARAPDPGDLFRMPVDRAFSVAGAGTVVTGSIWSGTVARGGELLLLPAGERVRVRSLECFGEPREQVAGRERVAVAIAGGHREAAERGSMLVEADAGWRASRRLDVVVDLTTPITRRTRVHVLHGTAQVTGWLSPRSEAPGAARLSLDRPVVARGGDAFIVRSPSPLATIGGGRIVDPAPEPRAPWPAQLASPDDGERLHALLARRRHGANVDDLAILLGVPQARALALARQVPDARMVGSRVMLRDRADAVARHLVDAVGRYHRDFPANPGIPSETLRQQAHADSALVAHVLGELLQSGLLVQDGPVVRLPRFSMAVPGGDAAVDRMVGAIEAGGLAPPAVHELDLDLDQAARGQVLRRAVALGRLVMVAPGRAYAPAALHSFREVLSSLGAQGPIGVAALREVTGLSRKYLIPLLEWSDRAGHTRRDGDLRHWLGAAVREPASEHA